MNVKIAMLIYLRMNEYEAIICKIIESLIYKIKPGGTRIGGS
jgi:hypothetical protein